MDILVLKLVLAPVIIGSASLAGRKWGHDVSGWIVGMPLTSGPVIFFVALSHDVTFASNAALGVISGGLPLVYCPYRQLSRFCHQYCSSADYYPSHHSHFLYRLCSYCSWIAPDAK